MTESHPYDETHEYDVMIAGSGPIGAAFARTLLEEHPTAKICMADIGALEGPVVGEHHKNAAKYQKDIDAFVNVIRGALQNISIPPGDSHLPTLGTNAWTPPAGTHLTQSYHNPQQKPEKNLKSYVTRAVGGMTNHWTCACPRPHPEEHVHAPVSKTELHKLLDRATELIGVRTDQFECSMRHTYLRHLLQTKFGKDRVKDLPLGVKRINKDYVTWSAVDTILGGYHTKYEDRFKLEPQLILIRILTEDPVLTKDASSNDPQSPKIVGALLRRVVSGKWVLIKAKHYVIACGAVGTPQILFNSGITPPALGHYLTEQSLAFCQIVLKREIVDAMVKEHEAECKGYHDAHKEDTLPIPWNDPDPQLTMPYDSEAKRPWHVQIHRDAFSYGDVGPRADPRVIVDLRWFGKQDINQENCVYFGDDPITPTAGVFPHKDAYGMPQATFHVTRSEEDGRRDHEMMHDMCNVAKELGPYLPGSEPQFMEPGLVLHIAGTTRLGEIIGNEEKDAKTRKETVADQNSKVHGFPNLFVGGNGCIPDSTACNPTLTSVAYAVKSARYIMGQLDKPAES
ncbi:Pyranose 2-oxidase [Ceratobasidium sp. 428]|nr:Pyranose 2-oxidase [Ceratobasidium sp. 428]